MRRRAWIVSGLWVLYAIVLGSYRQFEWATTAAVLVSAAALALGVGHFLLDAIRETHAPGRFRAYPLWFRRLLHDS